MTDNETIKAELEARIREAVPESMELKFGCEVETISEAGFLNYGTILKTEERENRYGKKKLFYYVFSDEIGARWIPKVGINRILGRPLGLADVLIALQKEFYELNLSLENYAGVSTVLEIYDLTKDYHQQSEEFYQFLHNLLVR